MLPPSPVPDRDDAPPAPEPPARRGRPAQLGRARTTVALDRSTKEAIVRRARQRQATLGEVIAEAMRRLLASDDEAGARAA